MRTLVAFILAIPEIIELIERIQKQIEEAQIQRTVKDDLKAINEAFKEKDESKLKNIFTNNRT